MRYIGLILFVCSLNAFAQEDYHFKLQQDAFELANKGDYAAALEKGKELYAAHNDNVNAHVIVAFSMINLGRYKEASPYIGTAMAIDPTNSSNYFVSAYYSVLDGKMNDAKTYLTEALKVRPKEIPLQDDIDEMRKVGVNTNKAAAFNELADWYGKQFYVIKERYPTLNEAAIEFGQDYEKVRTVADSYAAKYTAMKWPEMALAVYANACSYLRDTGSPSAGLDAAEEGYNYYRKYGYGANPFLAAQLITELMRTYNNLGNDEKVIDYVDEVYKLSDKLPVHVPDVNAMTIAAGAMSRLGRNDDARAYATAAYKLAEKAGYRYGAVSAANLLCMTYNFVRFNTDLNNAIYYGETALQMGLNFKFELLLGPIMDNLSLAYYKLGTYEGQAKCIQTYGSLVALYKQKKMWSSAAVTLNNMGAIMMQGGSKEGYQYAVTYFEESIQLANQGMGNLNTTDKLSFYQSTISAYEFLTECYAFLDNAEKAYEAIEASRSRVLTERLANGKEVKPGTIADLQRVLQPDEAAIFYSLIAAHEVIILVVTKKYSKVMVHTDDAFIGKIKEKYLDRMNKEHGERSGKDNSRYVDGLQMEDFQKVTQLTRRFFEKPGMADDVLKEYLQGYYKFLILPVLNRLGGIKSLLISPDKVLNYIPFEAMQLHNGKYLVETYSVRYLNSTGAFRLIEGRQYGARKPLLAMGGAIYEPNLTKAPVIQTQYDMNALRAEVEENKNGGKSQRRAYAALFGNGAMNPLPGTLAEVDNLSKNVPGAEVFTGRNFTENQLKEMSKNGSLKQFRVLHLATHGFVVEDIPDLSGVAMSVFSKEEGGEDGFLNVNEIAALNLNADLTVLSACQTALGKIYSGEGVTGLTQSLLIAGSNAALVSLWPVNDTSTSLFMSDLYKEVQKGKSYSQVVTEIKRKFIKGQFGDEFKHPNYWAPFIYFGK